MKHSPKDDDEDSRRVNVKLSQEEYDRFKILCKEREEGRSMTNFATVLVRRYIRDAWDKYISQKPES